MTRTHAYSLCKNELHRSLKKSLEEYYHTFTVESLQKTGASAQGTLHTVYTISESTYPNSGGRTVYTVYHTTGGKDMNTALHGHGT